MGNVTSMALSRKKATTIALDPADDRLLTRAARERGVSRSEFIRQQLALVLEQYRRHRKPSGEGGFSLSHPLTGERRRQRVRRRKR